MQNSEYLVDDGNFGGIFSDIDRATKATAARLKAAGIEQTDPRFLEYIGSVEDAIIADRRRFLYDEALQSGRPQKYAEYRSAAYAAGRSVMPFDVWKNNQRSATQAEIGDFMGGAYVTLEQSAGSTVGGTVSAALDQFGEAGEYRHRAERYGLALKARDNILYERKRALEAEKKKQAYFDGLEVRPEGESPSVFENLLPIRYKDQVDWKVKTPEEIEREYPIPDSLKQELAEFQPSAEMYGKILYQNYMTGQNVKGSVVSGIRDFSLNTPEISILSGSRQLANPSDPFDVSLKSDVLQDTTGVGKFFGEVVGTTLVSAPAYINPLALAPFFPMGYQGGQERLINNFAQEARKAELLGLEAPKAPYERLRQAGLAGGFSEILSEGVGNTIEKAVLLNKAWKGADQIKRGTKVAKRVELTAFQRLARDILEGATATKGGSKGFIAGAAKRGVRGTRMLGRVGIAAAVEALEEVANETVLSIGVDSMTGSSDFKQWMENSLHASLVAAASAGGTSGVVLARAGREYQRLLSDVERATREQFGDNWKEGVDQEKAEALIASAIVASSERHAGRKLSGSGGFIGMFPHAYGEQAALRQVNQYTDSTRMGVLVEKRAKDVTLTKNVREAMESAGIDVDNPLEYGETLIYTSPSFAPQVAAAYETGQLEKVDGNLSLGKKDPNGFAFVKNRSGQILELIPASSEEMADEESAFFKWKAATEAQGHEVGFVEGESAAAMADSLTAQVDAERKLRGKPPLDTPKSRPVNIRSGIQRLREGLLMGLSNQAKEDPSIADQLGFDSTKPVSVDVKLTAVSNKRLNSDEQRMTQMGMAVAVLQGHLEWTGTDKDGKQKKVKTPIPQKGLYAHQASEDGLFLVRDDKGTAFTFRNAWATIIHEAMHRNVARSRGGARWLNLLFSMAPEENIAEGLKALRNYPTLGGGSMTDAELMNDMIARYEAAQRVMGDPNATDEERATARKQMADVRTFGEEMGANVVESAAGSMSAHAAAYVMALQHEKGMSMMKFGGWLAHMLVKNGFSGPTARAIHDMMIQRAQAVREAELQIDEKYRKDATKRYESALRNEMEWRRGLQQEGAEGKRSEPRPAPVEKAKEPAFPPPSQPAEGLAPPPPPPQGETESPMASMRGQEEKAPPSITPFEVAQPPEEKERKSPSASRRDAIIADAVGMIASALPFATATMAQVVPSAGTTEGQGRERLRRAAEGQPRKSAEQLRIEEEAARQQQETPAPAPKTTPTPSFTGYSTDYEPEYLGVMASFRTTPRVPEKALSMPQRRWLSAKGKSVMYRPSGTDRSGNFVEGEATEFVHGTATPDGKPWSTLRPSEYGRWGRGIYLWRDEGGALDWARKKRNDNLVAGKETKPVVIRVLGRMAQPFYVDAMAEDPMGKAIQDPRNQRHIKRNAAKLADLAESYNTRQPATYEVRDRAEEAVKDRFQDILRQNGFDGMVVENSARATDFDEVAAGIRDAKRGEKPTVSEIIVFDSKDVKETANRNPQESPILMASMRPIQMASLPTRLKSKLRGTVLHDKQMDEVGIVYHGTAAKDEFTKFSEEMLGANTGAASAKKAFFFSDNPDVASGYALQDAVVGNEAEAASPISTMNVERYQDDLDRAERSEIVATFDEDENGWVPNLRYEDSYGEEYIERIGGVRGPTYQTKVEAEDAAFDQQLRMISERSDALDKAIGRKEQDVSDRARGSRLMPSMLAMKNPLVHDFKGESWREKSFNELIDKAREEGHDGVVFQNVTDPAVDKPWAAQPSNVYAVFKQSQIIPALATDTAEASEYMASMRQPIDLSERPQFRRGSPRYQQSPFTPRMLLLKNLLRDHIVNGTPLVGVPAGKPVAIKDWIAWMTKNGMNTAQLRFSLPWLFRNKQGLPVGRITRDRAAEAEARAKRKAAEEQAAKEGRTLKPLPEPLGVNEKLTPLQLLAELEASVPWTYIPTYLGLNSYPNIRGRVQRANGDNYEVGMVLSPTGEGTLTDAPAMLREIAQNTLTDPALVKEAQFLSTSVLQALPLRDVVAQKMDTKFTEGHWHMRNLLMHYRYTLVQNPRMAGDMFADELQSTFRARGQQRNNETDQFYFPFIEDPTQVADAVALNEGGMWNLQARVREIPILNREAIPETAEVERFSVIGNMQQGTDALTHIPISDRINRRFRDIVGELSENDSVAIKNGFSRIADAVAMNPNQELASLMQADIDLNIALGKNTDQEPVRRRPMIADYRDSGGQGQNMAEPMLIPIEFGLMARHLRYTHSIPSVSAQSIIDRIPTLNEQFGNVDPTVEVDDLENARKSAAVMQALCLDTITVSDLIDKEPNASAEETLVQRVGQARRVTEFVLNSMPSGTLDVDYMSRVWPDVDWASAKDGIDSLAKSASERMTMPLLASEAETYRSTRPSSDTIYVNSLADGRFLREARTVLASSPALAKEMKMETESIDMDKAVIRATKRMVRYNSGTFRSLTTAMVAAKVASRISGKEIIPVLIATDSNGQNTHTYYGDTVYGPKFMLVTKSGHEVYMSELASNQQGFMDLVERRRAAYDAYMEAQNRLGYYEAETEQKRADYNRLDNEVGLIGEALHEARDQMFRMSRQEAMILEQLNNWLTNGVDNPNQEQFFRDTDAFFDAFAQEMSPLVAPAIASVISNTLSSSDVGLNLLLAAAHIGGMNTLYKRASPINEGTIHRIPLEEAMIELRNGQSGNEELLESAPYAVRVGHSPTEISGEVVRPTNQESHPRNHVSYYEDYYRPDVENKARTSVAAMVSETLETARYRLVRNFEIARGLALATDDHLRDDTEYARTRLQTSLQGAEGEAARNIEEGFRLSFRASNFFNAIAHQADTESAPFHTIINTLLDRNGPRRTEAAETENPPNPQGLFRPAPLTHELKDAKGAVISEDFLHALFSGLVRDAFGHGGGVGTSIVFGLPNDTATNSMMPPLAAASYYGWERESAIIEIWENLVRGNFENYTDADGVYLSNGVVPQTSNAPQGKDEVETRQNEIEKSVNGQAVIWRTIENEDGTQERRLMHSPSSIQTKIIREIQRDNRPKTLAEYNALVETVLSEWRESEMDRLRERAIRDNREATEEEIRAYVDGEMRTVTATFHPAQTEKLFISYLKTMDERAAAAAENRPPKSTKGILRAKLESWSAEHGGSVVYDVYPNTDNKPRMQLVIDERLKQTATDGFPMGSMRRGLGGGFDMFRQVFLDKYGELKRLTDEDRRRRGGSLPDASNPYLGARLLSDKINAQRKDLQREYATILRQMHEEGISLDIMDQFLLAQHAKERNELIARRNPTNPAMQDGGSGMRTQDAIDIIDNARANGTYAMKDRIARQWRSLLRRNLDMRVESGLMTQDHRDMLDDQWKRYVPLRGKPYEPLDEDFESFEGSSQGTGALSTAGRGVPVAHGRESMAEAITSQIGFVSEDTLSRVERNNIGNRFLNLVLSTNDPLMAEVVNPTRRVLVNGISRPIFDFQWANDPRHFGLYLNRDMVINGEQYNRGDQVIIRINNARLATAMGKAIDVGMLRRVLETPNSVFRTVTTGLLSPVFMAGNVLRDFSMGALRNYSKHGMIDTAMMVKGYPTSAWNIIKDEILGQGPTGAYKDFIAAGGDMIYLHQNDLEQKAMDFDRMSESVSRRDPNQTPLQNYLFGWYPALFKASEAAMRLAHYRRRVDMGDTPEQAALSARELTIDFRKGGTLKPIFNTLWIYSNAGIQGSAATLQSLGEAKELGAMLVAAGFLTGMLARACAGVDPKMQMNRWDMVSPYEKAASIHLYHPDQSGRGVKIPQPYGFNVLFTLGQDIADATLGGTTTRGDVLSNTVDNSLNFLNPFGGSGVTKGMENMVSFAFPTLLRWMPELAQNTDFANRPIYPENKFGPETAKAYQAFDNTPELYRWAAEKANEFSGGNEIDSGVLDFHPDSLEYMIGFIFSGAGRAVQNTIDVAQGEKPISEAPFMRQFTISPNVADKYAMSQFYKLRDELSKEIVRAREMAKGDTTRNLGTLDPQRYAMALEMKEIDSQIKELRKQLKATNDPATIEAIKNMRLDLMKSMVSRYHSLTKGK